MADAAASAVRQRHMRPRLPTQRFVVAQFGLATVFAWTCYHGLCRTFSLPRPTSVADSLAGSSEAAAETAADDGARRRPTFRPGMEHRQVSEDMFAQSTFPEALRFAPVLTALERAREAGDVDRVMDLMVINTPKFEPYLVVRALRILDKALKENDVINLQPHQQSKMRMIVNRVTKIMPRFEEASGLSSVLQSMSGFHYDPDISFFKAVDDRIEQVLPMSTAESVAVLMNHLEWPLKKYNHRPPDSLIVKMVEKFAAEACDECANDPLRFNQVAAVFLRSAQTLQAKIKGDEVKANISKVMTMSMAAVGPKRLTPILTSLNRLGITLDEPLVKAFEKEILLNFDDLTIHQPVFVLTSFADNHYNASDEVWATVEAHTLKHLSRLKAPDLQRFPMACQELGYRPSDELLDKLVYEARRKMPAFEGKDAILLVWALSKLGYDPGTEFLDEATAKIKMTFNKQPATDMARLLYAYGKFRYQPGEDMLELISAKISEDASQIKLHLLVPSIGAYGELLYNPTDSVMTELLFAVRKQYKPTDFNYLSIVLWASAKMQHNIKANFVEWALGQLNTNLSKVTREGLVRVVYSLAKMKYEPSKEIMQAFYKEMQKRLPKTTDTQALTLPLWAAGKLEFNPGKKFLDESAKLLRTNAGSLQPGQVYFMLNGFETLDYDPGATWMKAIMSKIRDKLPSYGASVLSQVVSTYTRFNYDLDADILKLEEGIRDKKLAADEA